MCCDDKLHGDVIGTGGLQVVRSEINVTIKKLMVANLHKKSLDGYL